MTQEMQFRNKVNWVSITCAILVVFLHSYSFSSGSQNTLAYHLEFFISRNIAQASVPTFFALSAFLFYRNFDYSKLRSKYYSRLKSLVLPYLIWNAISMAAFYFISKLSFINMESFEINLNTLKEGILFYRYNHVFWFVYQLILLTYLFPLVYPVLKNKIISVALFALMIWMYATERTVFLCFEVKALIYYSFGAYFAVHHESAVVSNRKISAVGVVAFLISQVMIYSSYADTLIVTIVARLLMIVAVFYFANLFNGRTMPAILNCSFPIYAMHNLILEFFNKVFSFILNPASNWILIDYIGSAVMTVVIIAVINMVLLKKFPKLHTVLFGGRGK